MACKLDLLKVGGRCARLSLNRLYDRQFGQSQRLVSLWSAMSADDSIPDDVTMLKARSGHSL